MFLHLYDFEVEENKIAIESASYGNNSLVTNLILLQT